MNLKRRALPFLAALRLSPAARADHTSADIKDFRIVCADVGLEAKTMTSRRKRMA
ncbi:hypothetical protein [Deinococcus hopiensis]|uniref:Uncharacterized protein n=1 Tax=Deinococcus hopiensis KR-140 TaxID=695939 RepID=A0A1W1USX1_9DEIO|nr:hypothetical protein [Deinococcus hopiensis]SMB84153.1 hypothetical protein SAMN00790413_05013 [Deinococcus hopiensis KR-140]